MKITITEATVYSVRKGVVFRVKKDGDVGLYMAVDDSDDGYRRVLDLTTGGTYRIKCSVVVEAYPDAELNLRAKA